MIHLHLKISTSLLLFEDGGVGVAVIGNARNLCTQESKHVMLNIVI